MTKQLSKADAIVAEIERAQSPREAKELRDRASALLEYFKARKGYQSEATEAALAMLRADRKGGELLIRQKQAGLRADVGQGSGKGRSVQPLPLSALDIDKTWASLAQRLYRIPADDFEAEIKRWGDREGLLDVPGLRAFLRILDELKVSNRADERRKAAKGLVARNIIVGDFREKSDAIPDGSLSLIFTDPPYLRGDEEVFPGLADFASRKLAPGGSILFYIGHLQLPAAFAAFDGKLRHWWTCACVHAGGKTLMREYGIRVGWKPILWFVRETREDRLRNIVFDTISGSTEKQHHEWQQSEAEARYWIEALCPEDGIVCDPFLGSGTTALAAKKAGRKWVGFEIDPDTAGVASKRIVE